MTAVEWLINEWLYLDQQFDMCLIDRNIYWDKLRQIQEQAKEMDKEQVVDAFFQGVDRESDGHGVMYLSRKDAEQYYNEKFKSE